jgi:hypothetical protein
MRGGLERVASSIFRGTSIDVTVGEQTHSTTVHLVILTNPMLLKGPVRELIPVQVPSVLEHEVVAIDFRVSHS